MRLRLLALTGLRSFVASVTLLCAPLHAENMGPESHYQMQLLQQEVMQLRGLVESLDYEIKRQKSVADDRYLELDARLQNL